MLFFNSVLNKNILNGQASNGTGFSIIKMHDIVVTINAEKKQTHFIQNFRLQKLLSIINISLLFF